MFGKSTAQGRLPKLGKKKLGAPKMLGVGAVVCSNCEMSSWGLLAESTRVKRRERDTIIAPAWNRRDLVVEIDQSVEKVEAQSVHGKVAHASPIPASRPRTDASCDGVRSALRGLRESKRKDEAVLIHPRPIVSEF